MPPARHLVADPTPPLLLLRCVLCARSGVPCGTGNEATAGCCCVCGAARWDGPDGQVQQRIAAALQTADLDATNLRQVRAAGGTRARTHTHRAAVC